VFATRKQEEGYEIPSKRKIQATSYMDIGDIVHATLCIKDVEIVIFHGIKCNSFSRIIGKRGFHHMIIV
jgi:hypothetical protein